MYNSIVEDEKGRRLLVIDEKKQVAVARYPDMDEDMKNYIIEVYEAITGSDGDGIRGFLNYENDNEPCS